MKLRCNTGVCEFRIGIRAQEEYCAGMSAKAQDISNEGSRESTGSD